MSGSHNSNIKESKVQARLSYANRNIYKWINWRLENFGRIPYKHLMEQRKIYGLDK